MGYSLDPVSADCYPNTTVLENRFNIREQSKLDEYAGFHLDFSTIDTDLLMMATIQSAHGVTDLLKRVLGEGVSEL